MNSPKNNINTTNNQGNGNFAFSISDTDSVYLGRPIADFQAPTGNPNNQTFLEQFKNFKSIVQPTYQKEESSGIFSNSSSESDDSDDQLRKPPQNK